MPRINVTTGVPGDDQAASFQNATLQTAGDQVEFSVAAHVAVPADIAAGGEQAVADFVAAQLTPATEGGTVTFDVQVGPAGR